MPSHLRELLLFPVRTRPRALLTATLLVVLCLGGWFGMRVYRFGQNLSAAKESLAKYDFPEARRRLASCLSQRPRDPAALLLATQADRREGLLSEAEEHLDRYRDAVGQTTPEGALQGVLLRVQRGEVKPFVHSLLDFLEIRHPDSEQIFEALARGCVHGYRLDEATFWIRQLLDRYPDNPVGRLLDAQTNETLRRRDRAIEITRHLVEDYPELDRARQYLAVLLVKAHKYDEAARHYRDLRQRNPTDLTPLLGLASTLVTLGRLEEAEPLLRELEEQHGDNSEALLECGRFALRQKRPGDAESLLQRARKLAPNDHEVHYELALCLGQLNRTEESKKHLERFKQIQADLMRLEKVFQAMVKSPSDPEPRLEAGQICLRNGQVSEGLRWLNGALDLAPNHKATHQALADHFDQVGDRAQADRHRAKAR